MKKILASMFLPDVSWELPMVDLGEGPGGPGPPLILVKKIRITEGRKDSKASDKKNQPPPH